MEKKWKVLIGAVVFILMFIRIIWVRQEWLAKIQKETIFLRTYEPRKYSDSISSVVDSVFYSKASFYVRSVDLRRFRVDAFEYLDYVSKDYNLLMQKGFLLEKKVNNDTIFIYPNIKGRDPSILIIDRR